MSNRKRMFVFKIRYVIATLVLLLIEVAIAFWSVHPFIRGLLGDVLVVLLLYTFLKSFLSCSSERIAFTVLLFAFGIEFLQLADLTEALNIQNPVLKIVVGSVFDPWDLLAYLTGFFIIILIEKLFRKNECA